MDNQFLNLDKMLPEKAAFFLQNISMENIFEINIRVKLSLENLPIKFVTNNSIHLKPFTIIFSENKVERVHLRYA